MKKLSSLVVMLFLVSQIYSQPCPAPTQCLSNWSPSPCLTCSLECDDCIAYFYCGNSALNEECDILVYCRTEKQVKLYKDGVLFGSSGVNGSCSSPYIANPAGNSLNGYNGVITLEVYETIPNGGTLLCKDTYNFNCY